MELTREQLVQACEAWGRACQLATRDVIFAQHEAHILRQGLLEIVRTGSPVAAIATSALERANEYRENPPQIECGD